MMPGSSIIGTTLAEAARSEIGVTEDYPYQNRGEWIDRWNDMAKAPRGSSWCASFAGAMWIAVGLKPPAEYAACASWPIDHSIEQPIEGDLALYNFEGGSVAHHCGIVYKVLPDRILTIEGNTSLIPNDREGFGVFLKERFRPKIGSLGILGYVRPQG